ncbi:hypothetical protein F0562_011353 [Nyssa sinensis]|uniref:Reverse transcriptase Ty1/copia-type domain-containing protein n=1 Tax=Nyssa sinensis TaxID=561372 RepID=A0A5J5A3U1_9ASTE|nr:hypothetical protein F0562_011353 [Nyssa sinensis]
MTVNASVVKADVALYGKTKKLEKMTNDKWEELKMRAVCTIRICLADEVMYQVMDEESSAGIWAKLESRYISKLLTNKLYLKQKLYRLKMIDDADLTQHINTFNEIISDLLRIDLNFDDEDKALMLLTSFSASYEHLVTTLLWGKETQETTEVMVALLAYNQRK